MHCGLTCNYTSQAVELSYISETCPETSGRHFSIPPLFLSVSHDSFCEVIYNYGNRIFINKVWCYKREETFKYPTPEGTRKRTFFVTSLVMNEETLHYGNHHLFLSISQRTHFIFLTAKLEYHTATYLRNQKNLSKKCKKSCSTQIGCAEIIIFAAESSENCD